MPLRNGRHTQGHLALLLSQSSLTSAIPSLCYKQRGFLPQTKGQPFSPQPRDTTSHLLWELAVVDCHSSTLIVHLRLSLHLPTPPHPLASPCLNTMKPSSTPCIPMFKHALQRLFHHTPTCTHTLTLTCTHIYT